MSLTRERASAVASPESGGAEDFIARYRLLIWCVSASLILLFTVICSPTRKQLKPIDFIYFYSASEIVNRMPAEAVYNPAIQGAVCQHLFALPGGVTWGRFLYPPFVLLLLSPLAKISFLSAYHLYQGFAATLYILGLLRLLRTFFPSQKRLASVVIPLAFAVIPFLVNTWLNGQLAVFGFFSIALALGYVKSENLFRAGLALSICAYKPTLLLLLLPMLVFNKQFRVLAGFLSGAAAAFVVGLAAFGWRAWSAYGNLLLWSNGVEHRQFSLYADFASFFSLLGPTRFALPLSLLGGLLIAPFLIAAWLRYKDCPSLVWAVTITWTLLLNTYAPLYDTILIVPSLIASWTAFHFAGHHRRIVGLLLLFAFSSVTPLSASNLHLQIWTLAIAALGSLQLMVCLKPTQQPPALPAAALNHATA